MKLLAITDSYGGRATIRLGWNAEMLYFVAPEPAPRTLVCIELPGLRASTSKAVIEWITAGFGVDEIKPAGRRELNELPAGTWRKAVLDDFIDGEHWQTCVWLAREHFDAEAFDAFAARWVPEARAKAGVAFDKTDRKRRAAALKRAVPLASRVYGVLAQAPLQLGGEAQKIVEQLEATHVAELRRSPVDVEKWIETAKRLRTPLHVMDLLTEVGHTLVREHASEERVAVAIELIRQSKKLHQATVWGPRFWSAFAPLLRLDPTEVGKEIDISAAQEQTVQLNWTLLEGRRVGRIVPGRTALVVADPMGPIYVRGERKLKFRVARAGGRLRRMENTLVVETGKDSVHRALLDVDRLDTLANVDPRRALAEVAERGLPDDHPVRAAAKAAETDPRHARVLADLLIEIVVGMDADIARVLARSQSRANRR